MSKQSTRCIATVVLVLAGFGSSQALAQQAPPPALVKTALATQEVLAAEIQVPGTVISKNDARISSEITGRIVWIAEVGDKVMEGDVIARIDDRISQVAVTQARSAVGRLEADIRFRTQEEDRIRELAGLGRSPGRRLQEVESQLEMAKQDLVNAEAALQRATDDLERTQVRAPFPGRVVERLAQIGEYSNVGSRLVRLVDTTHVEIRMQVPISVAPFISDGQLLSVSDDSKILRMPVRTVIPVGDEISRMMEARLSLSPEQWVIGSAVKVGLPTSRAVQVLAVPRDALILRANGMFVFVVDEDNTAIRVAVETGAASGDMIAIEGDIRVGQRVVVRGGERLRDGQTVSFGTLAS